MTSRQCSLSGTRKLKSHSKSRLGCINCKLRKVKCDESKPACRKCRLYNVICTYDPKAPSLQLSIDGSKDSNVSKTETWLGTETILSMQNNPANPSSPPLFKVISENNQFDLWNLSLLDKFHRRTISTLGMGWNKHANRANYLQLAVHHPFLQHIMITVTIMHDRHLGIDMSLEQAKAMAFHWSQGASLMNQKITRGIEESERDALWACAALLGALGFASIEAQTPEVAWPMRSASPTDLDWLKLVQGKRALWQISNPLRANSIFYPTMPDFMQFALSTSYPIPEIEDLPIELLTVCNIDEKSTSDTNDYLEPVSALAQLFTLDCNRDSFGKFMCFFGVMHLRFKKLLMQKDSCALIILAFWYAKICRFDQWWLWRRATFECQAICIHLKLHYGTNREMMRLVQIVEGMDKSLKFDT